MSGPDCVLITDDYLPHLGGSRLYYHRVASLLAGRIAVVTKWRPGGEDFDASAAYPISRVRLRNGPPAGPAGVFEALDAVALARAAALRFGRPRCYLAGEVTPSAFAAALAARRNRVRYGVVVHDEPLSGAGRLERVVRRRVLAGASGLVVSSSFPRRRAREIVGEDVPIFSAPPGVDTESFHPGMPDPATLERFGLARAGFLICVGRLVRYKNIQAVIRALAQLGMTNLRLVVVGEGPYRGELELLVGELSLGDRVVMAGRVGRGLLVELYRGALAYVFPTISLGASQREGIGMAALEAAACGCPVIASSETSACDFVEDERTGLIFDPAEPGSLERAIRALASAPGRRHEMASRCMENVRRRFTWPAAAAGVAEAIDHVAGSCGAPHASSCLA